MRLIWSVSLAALVGLAGGCTTTRIPTALETRLPAPSTEAQRAYLGLSNDLSGFRLEEIRCDVLVVDCFDMYCHVCQSGAPSVNRLYSMIQNRGLGERVKMVGLGVGDTPLEVATYRDKFKVPFPVFPDRHAAVARSLGPLRVPNLIVLKKQGNQFKSIYSNPGELREPEQFLSHLQTSLTGALPVEWAKPVVSTQPTCTPGSSACRRPAVLNAEAGLPSACPALH